jgi:hypothetical protein
MRMLALLVVLAGCVRDRPVDAPMISAQTPVTSAPPRATGAPPSGSADLSMIGTWEGVGTQDDGISWPMIVKVLSLEPGTCATADYPSLRCRAYWQCAGTADGVLQAEEHLIDDGATRCVDNGAMTMRLRGDGLLEWMWTGQGQSASSTLRRAR